MDEDEKVREGGEGLDPPEEETGGQDEEAAWARDVREQIQELRAEVTGALKTLLDRPEHEAPPEKPRSVPKNPPQEIPVPPPPPPPPPPKDPDPPAAPPKGSRGMWERIFWG